MVSSMKNIKLLCGGLSLLLIQLANSQPLTTPVASTRYISFHNMADQTYFFMNDGFQFSDTTRVNGQDVFFRGTSRFVKGASRQIQLGFFSRGNDEMVPSPNNVNRVENYRPENGVNFVSVRVTSPTKSPMPFLGKLCSTEICGGTTFPGGSKVSDGIINIPWETIFGKASGTKAKSYHHISNMSFVISDGMYPLFHNLPVGDNPIPFNMEYCASKTAIKSTSDFSVQTCNAKVVTGNGSSIPYGWISAPATLKHVGAYTILGDRHSTEVFVDTNGVPTILNPSAETCRVVRPDLIKNFINPDAHRYSGILCRVFNGKHEGAQPMNVFVPRMDDPRFQAVLNAPLPTTTSSTYYVNQYMRVGFGVQGTNISTGKWFAINPSNESVNSMADLKEWGPAYIFIPRYALEFMVRSPQTYENGKEVKYGEDEYKNKYKKVNLYDFAEQLYFKLSDTDGSMGAGFYTFKSTTRINLAPIDYGIVLRDITKDNETRSATLPSSTPTKYTYELAISSRDDTTYKGPANKITVKVVGDDLNQGNRRAPGYVRIDNKNYCRFFSVLPDSDGNFMEVAIPAYLTYQVAPGQMQKVKGDSGCGSPTDPAIDITPKESGGTVNPAYFSQVPWDDPITKGNFFRTQFELVFPMDDVNSFRTLASPYASPSAASPGVDWMGTTVKGSGRVEVKVQWNTSK